MSAEGLVGTVAGIAFIVCMVCRIWLEGERTLPTEQKQTQPDRLPLRLCHKWAPSPKTDGTVGLICLYCQETHDGPISTEMLFGRCVASEEYESMVQRERRGGAR